MRERQFTDKVATILRDDGRFRVGLATSLVRAAATRRDGPGRRAVELKRHLPRKHVSFASQGRYPHRAGFFAVASELLGGRLVALWNDVDWVWQTDLFLFMVEVKTAKRPVFQPEQLDRYTKAAKRAHIAHFGVMAVTTRPPDPYELQKVHGRKAFLGSVLWRDVGPALRTLIPSQPEHALACSDMLDEPRSDARPSITPPPSLEVSP